MKESLKERCELLADNYTLVSNSFKWEFEMMNMVAAINYTNLGMKADPEKMMECREILKKKHGYFSEMRSTIELAILSEMALEKNPAAYLDEVTAVYEKIKAHKILTSEYMVLSALIICEQRKVGQADEVIKRTKSLIKKMEKKHPFLTGYEDMPFATLMAMLIVEGDKLVVPVDEDKLIEDMESCFTILKKKFPMHTDAVQGLCEVLTLCSGGTEDKCAKAAEIFDELKKAGVKYGKSTELAALGALVDLEMDADAIAREIAECSEYLKKHKGFGNLALGKEYRAMFAALLVAEEYSSESKSIYASTLGSSIAVIIAEEIVMMIIMASMAASTSSN